MTLRRPRVLALVATFAVALTACTAGSSSTSTSGSGGSAGTASVSLGLVAEPASLDFTAAAGAAIPQLLMSNVYETLVAQDDTGKVVPALAKSWTISEDRKTYTFELVDTAKFTDGKPFTAEDAVFSIGYVKSSWKTALKKPMDVVADVKALSPSRLQVTLTQPSNDWLFRMTTHMGAMMTQAQVGDLANKAVGTGPYTVTSRTRGDSITLTRNDAYWGPKPYFQTVVFKYFKDGTALNNALLSGGIDVITTMQAPDALGQFTGKSKYQVIEGTTNGEVLLSFNNAHEIFQDKRVRQAIRQGIDDKALMAACFAGHGTLIGSFVPPTDPWYEDLTGVLPFDKAAATAAIAAAGKAGATLRLRVPNLPYAVSCGQVVKSQLEQIGLSIQLDTLEFPAAWVTSVYSGGDFDMSIVAHVEARDIPAVFGDPTYYTKYGTPQIRELLAKADSGSEADQVSTMKQVGRLIAEDVPGDVLFLLPNLMVADAKITGLPKNSITSAFEVAKLAKS